MELGILIALETHNCYLHDLPAPSRKLMDITNHDAVGVNLDYCNILLHKNKCSLAESVEQLDGKIYYAHLKNALVPQNSNTFVITQLEQGDINNLEFLELIKENLRSGIIATEYPSSGDGMIAAKRDMEYIKFLKQRLNIK
jgi:sugar phosphate isomerase/epimerase